MALSDYMTDEEWNACFYAFMGQHRASNLGASMHLTIDYLLKKGYQWQGLDEQGQKKLQISNGVNAPKIAGIAFGGLDQGQINEILTSGRNFLKLHAPELVDETDEEWEVALKEAIDMAKP